MIDMHAHWEAAEEISLRAQNGIVTCFSTGTPEEWRRMEALRSRPEILVSFGLHPWYADQYDLAQCRECLELCDFVGEIGMDSVWCEVPLKVQQEKLEQQLQVAADMNKPILLHTKGQERRIADMVRGFSGKVCVHWYSGPEADFERFLEQDCFFTLGPDTASLCRKGTRLNQRMVREIPAERLFVETDGISAVAWARGIKELGIEKIPEVLRENLVYAAEEKGLTADALEKTMQKNLQNFLGRDCMWS